MLTVIDLPTDAIEVLRDLLVGHDSFRIERHLLRSLQLGIWSSLRGVRNFKLLTLLRLIKQDRWLILLLLKYYCRSYRDIFSNSLYQVWRFID
jgi:hypothetical protein